MDFVPATRLDRAKAYAVDLLILLILLIPPVGLLAFSQSAPYFLSDAPARLGSLIAAILNCLIFAIAVMALFILFLGSIAAFASRWPGSTPGMRAAGLQAVFSQPLAHGNAMPVHVFALFAWFVLSPTCLQNRLLGTRVIRSQPQSGEREPMLRLPPSEPGLVQAPAGSRLLAHLMDWPIVAILVWALPLRLERIHGGRGWEEAKGLGISIAAFSLLGFAYFYACHRLKGASLGKLRMGLEELDLDTLRAPTGLRLLFRDGFYRFALFPLFWMGGLLALGSGGRALHDMIFHTRVVRRRAPRPQAFGESMNGSVS